MPSYSALENKKSTNCRNNKESPFLGVLKFRTRSQYPRPKTLFSHSNYYFTAQFLLFSFTSRRSKKWAKKDSGFRNNNKKFKAFMILWPLFNSKKIQSVFLCSVPRLFPFCCLYIFFHLFFTHSLGEQSGLFSIPFQI